MLLCKHLIPIEVPISKWREVPLIIDVTVIIDRAVSVVSVGKFVKAVNFLRIQIMGIHAHEEAYHTRRRRVSEGAERETRYGSAKV